MGDNYSPLNRNELKFVMNMFTEYKDDLAHILDYEDYRKFAAICSKIEAELQYEGHL